MTTLPESILDEFGANAEFVAQLYTQWRYSPVTVSEEWRRYFESLDGDALSGGNGERTASNGDGASSAPPAPAKAASPESPAPAKAAPPETPVPSHTHPPTGVVSPAALMDPELAAWEEAEPIRGVSALIVDNMEASLGMPTATSYRFVPVKVLEENRRVINDTLASKGIKVSFTYLISWAIIEALKKYPQMNATYAMINGKPHRILRHDVNLGVAIDVEKRDGSRSLIVPNIKGVNHLTFRGFMDAYGDLIQRAREGKLTTKDYQGTSITLTNPGTIGTVISVPRLMAGQGTIVATGAIAYPSEYSATDPAALTDLGISKVMGLSSTYDHRIIQGAESGMFLAEIEKLMLGEDGFYDRIFRSLLIPYPPVRWAQDNKLAQSFGAPYGLSEKEASVLQLIRAYRVRGHLLADLNPLTNEPKEYHPDLDPATYGLTLWDLDREFITGGLAGLKRATLRKILDILRRSYSGHIGVEFMNIQNPEERRWLQNRVEHPKPLAPLSPERKREILESLSKAEAFEQFLHKRYVGSKRFSLEGAESVIPLLETTLDRAAEQGAQESVMGMAHRGRLNVLKNIMQKSARAIFSEFEGTVDPESTQGTGDVKYHLGASGVRHCPGDFQIELTLASNPSHLEAVDPVVEGMTHAKQRLRVTGLDGLAIDEVLPVLIHGDSAFAGQGVVTETLNLAQLRGYRTGGTIHIIINNQIGFTTEPKDARSTPFATDIAKMSQIPIFHVNGDDPEAVIHAAEIALDYRNTFEKDVVIDLVCYRRWGHNEGDDPSYTQPRMYKLIERRNSPREVYAQQLLREKVISRADAQEMYDHAMAQLEEGTQGVAELSPPEVNLEYDATLDLTKGEPPETAVETETLIHISKLLANPPAEFVGHPKLTRQLKRRELKGDGSDRVEWATAELLAFGSLLMEKFPVRLSGQDSGRGTFSQRHSVLHNYDEDEEYIPLNHLSEGQAPFRVWDSMLSEEAVLGFEFGYSLAAPETLVLWEAQFGDFANAAQVQVDQFLASSATKWKRYSDLVMLLPHGFEGQGPEHSSARLERYLQLSAEDNWRVTVPSTPANYFHLLRRQKHDDVQRPLIVMTPKSLLRLPAAASRLEEMAEGRFQYVIDDPTVEDASQVRRIVFLSGKLYYDVLAEHKAEDGVAVVRVEQLYPYPREAIRALLQRYASATEVAWAQEEPRNQGAWNFIKAFVRDDLHDSAAHREVPLRYIGRPPAASPATGSFKVHQQEQAAIIRAILG